jgi:hypothetical protein
MLSPSSVFWTGLHPSALRLRCVAHAQLMPAIIIYHPSPCCCGAVTCCCWRAACPQQTQSIIHNGPVELQHAQLTHGSRFAVTPVVANRKVRRLPRVAPSSTDTRLEGRPIFNYVNDPTFSLFSPAAAAASHKPSRPSHTHTAYCTVQLRISLLHAL